MRSVRSLIGSVLRCLAVFLAAYAMLYVATLFTLAAILAVALLWVHMGATPAGALMLASPVAPFLGWVYLQVAKALAADWCDDLVA